ncbi:hypothetical protein ACIPUC_00745 [Streptomyces sp. LARHCF249]
MDAAHPRPAEAVRLRGWPAHLDTTIPVELESNADGAWIPCTLEVKNGQAQVNAFGGHQLSARLSRGQLAVWDAGSYLTAASTRHAGVTATSDEALTHLIRTTTGLEPWLLDAI